MQASAEEKRNPDQDLYSETMLSQDFDAQLKLIKSSKNDDLKREEIEAMENFVDDEEEEEEVEVEDENEEEEEEFSFMFGGENAQQIAAEDAFIDGQIKPVFPLFNQALLFSGEDSNNLQENLPMRPPVKKIFVETNEVNAKVTSPTPGSDEISGPYCELSSRKVVEASSEVCKKSNSTGFSKIWRFKELLGRSNSDGRDAFVFLNNGQPPASAAEQPVKGEEKGEKKESTVKIKGKGKKGGKSKTAPLSAHEVYLRSKAKEEERRRSYLPYRPELMGFFTNVSGGLSKNVHPF